MPVPLSQFGRDHWSTFGYLGSAVVGRGGEVDPRRMRADPKRHPALAYAPAVLTGRYPTLLANGEEIDDHDDWDCAEDLEPAGLLLNRGSGLNPEYDLTDEGWRALRAISDHRRVAGDRSAGSHASFRWPQTAPAPVPGPMSKDFESWFQLRLDQAPDAQARAQIEAHREMAGEAWEAARELDARACNAMADRVQEKIYAAPDPEYCKEAREYLRLLHAQVRAYRTAAGALRASSRETGVADAQCDRDEFVQNLAHRLVMEGVSPQQAYYRAVHAWNDRIQGGGDGQQAKLHG